MDIDWEIVARLALSCALGGIIGHERQARHKSAGLRTNILVCLGSCLMMMLSVAIEGIAPADAARIAAQVVSGIGFLGAGAIMKEGLTVTGLTTAACLWVVAGVGLAVGMGFYEGAIATTGFVFIVLGSLGHFFDPWMAKEDSFTFNVVAMSRPEEISLIVDTLKQTRFKLRGIQMRMKESAATHEGQPTIEAEIEIGSRQPIDRGMVLDIVRGVDGVIRAEAL